MNRAQQAQIDRLTASSAPPAQTANSVTVLVRAGAVTVGLSFIAAVLWSFGPPESGPLAAVLDSAAKPRWSAGMITMVAVRGFALAATVRIAVQVLRLAADTGRAPGSADTRRLRQGLAATLLGLNPGSTLAVSSSSLAPMAAASAGVAVSWVLPAEAGAQEDPTPADDGTASLTPINADTPDPQATATASTASPNRPAPTTSTTPAPAKTPPPTAATTVGSSTSSPTAEVGGQPSTEKLAEVAAAAPPSCPTVDHVTDADQADEPGGGWRVDSSAQWFDIAADNLADQLGRQPSIDELSDYLSACVAANPHAFLDPAVPEIATRGADIRFPAVSGGEIPHTL